jgi:hypothetical protein
LPLGRRSTASPIINAVGGSETHFGHPAYDGDGELEPLKA